jgi:hypothetical protein
MQMKPILLFCIESPEEFDDIINYRLYGNIASIAWNLCYLLIKK